jgi:hypothetical protein
MPLAYVSDILHKKNTSRTVPSLQHPHQDAHAHNPGPTLKVKTVPALTGHMLVLGVPSYWQCINTLIKTHTRKSDAPQKRSSVPHLPAICWCWVCPAAGNASTHSSKLTLATQKRPRNAAVSCTHWPYAGVGCAQQLAVHLDRLPLCRCGKQGLSLQQLPKDAAQRPCINGRAIAV